MALRSRAILPSYSSSWLMLFITLILLQYHIQSVAAHPLMLPNPQELSTIRSATPSTPYIITRSTSSLHLLAREAFILGPRSAALSRRSIFNAESGLALGTAIIVVVGVLIGVGVGMIAVCGFSWKGWCTRSRPKEHKERQIAVDETSQMMVDHTALRTPVPVPVPVASPSPSPRPSRVNLMTPAIPSTPLRQPGQYHGRGEPRGYETDEEQLNTRQEARPTGYI